MHRAEIYIEDNGDAADVKFVFPEGFHRKSPSHQMCNIIRQLLDDYFAQIGEGDTVTINAQQSLDLVPAKSLIQVN